MTIAKLSTAIGGFPHFLLSDAPHVEQLPTVAAKFSKQPSIRINTSAELGHALSYGEKPCAPTQSYAG